MHAWLCEQPTGVDALQWRELPTPEPGPQQVRVAIRAASLNFPDILIVQNKYQFKPEPPFVPGSEYSGVVEAVGPEVKGLEPGMRVLVIGSVGGHRYEVRDGAPALVKLPQIDYVDDKAGKPVAIQRAIGRRPIMAFGNSDGDFEMLEWTTAGDGPRLGLLVHHDDDAREWAYDRTSSIGRLDRGLSEAGARGWTVVSMRTDWKQVFRFE